MRLISNCIPIGSPKAIRYDTPRMTSSKVFVIIIASFNKECYKHMIAMRVQQLERRNIPYCFLFNGDLPADFSMPREKYFHFPTLSVDKFNNPQLTTPWATKAFRDVLQTLYKERNLGEYEYVLRLNVSTYVNFNNFDWMVQFLPKSGLVSGPLFVYKGRVFANGTAMLFSKDVAEHFAFKTVLDEELCATTNDDVVISWSLMDTYYLTDINLYFAWFEHSKEVPSPNDIFSKVRHETVFFRIKNDGDKRDEIDTYMWMVFFNAFA